MVTVSEIIEIINIFKDINDIDTNKLTAICNKMNITKEDLITCRIFNKRMIIFENGKIITFYGYKEFTSKVILVGKDHVKREKVTLDLFSGQSNTKIVRFKDGNRNNYAVSNLEYSNYSAKSTSTTKMINTYEPEDLSVRIGQDFVRPEVAELIYNTSIRVNYYRYNYKNNRYFVLKEKSVIADFPNKKLSEKYVRENSVMEFASLLKKLYNIDLYKCRAKKDSQFIMYNNKELNECFEILPNIEELKAENPIIKLISEISSSAAFVLGRMNPDAYRNHCEQVRNAKVGAIKELNNCISKSNDHSDNVQFGGHNIEEGICVGSNVIFNDGSIFSLDGIEQKSLVIDKQILIIDLYNRLNVNNRRN